LADEEGIAARLTSNGLSASRGDGMVGTGKNQSQLLGVKRAEFAYNHLTSLGSRARKSVRGAKGFQEGADVGLFAAITADEQERWGVGRTKNLAQERGAVQISPLQVVDEEDERVLVGEASEQLSESRESASTQFFGVGNGRGFATSFSDDLDLTQDGK